MEFNIKQHKNSLIFLPLGGAGEIGMNFNLYYYKGKWLIIDCGTGFAEDYMPGIDITVPNISYLLQYKSDILGIVLTHAHEDHIGAIQYLWDFLECPIYATKFTAEFLKLKLDEYSGKRSGKIHEIEAGGQINLDPFTIQMVPLSHSVPEMQALVVKTDLGNVFHTGDWKFDPNPLVGDVNSAELLKGYGDEGILAVVGDSTNVFTEGYSGSEGELKNSLIDLIASCKRMVIVTTFASNVGRVEALIEAAANSGRKVALLGRSLHRITQAARNSGYLLNMPDIVDARNIHKYDRDKILIIATGCQGEPLAAVTKIANKVHPTIHLKPGDTIIFSSKIIPGNDKKIFRVFNKLVQMGVEILTERDHFVHVSGHPARAELEDLYGYLRPEILIPVHGEHAHMHEHAKIGKKCGIKKCIEIENGVVLKLAPGEPQKLGKVPAGELAVYGNRFLKPDSNILKMRKKLKFDGVLFVFLVVSKNNALLADPAINAPGYLDVEGDKELMEYMIKEIKIAMQKKVRSLNDIKSSTDMVVRSILKSEIGKVPHIEILMKQI